MYKRPQAAKCFQDMRNPHIISQVWVPQIMRYGVCLKLFSSFRVRKEPPKTNGSANVSLCSMSDTVGAVFPLGKGEFYAI